jgi:hypothetical protein
MGWNKRDDKSNNGKPFVYDELVARMRAVLRRSNGPRHPRLTVRDLEIDLASRVVTVGGEPVQLSAKEYELLVALAEDPETSSKRGSSCPTSGASGPSDGPELSRFPREPAAAQAQPLARDVVRAESLGRGIQARREPPFRVSAPQEPRS